MLLRRVLLLRVLLLAGANANHDAGLLSAADNRAVRGR
jgi:hypothetical protein